MTLASPESVPVLSPAAVLRSAAPAPVTLLRVYGEDAFSYLQSQVSADLRVTGEGWVRYALWLDASGHVLADSFILCEGAESFLLFSYSTPAVRLEEIVLSNVIADDVEVEHLGDRYRHWALWAEGAEIANRAAAVASPAGVLPASVLPQMLQPKAGCFAAVDLQCIVAAGMPPPVSSAPAEAASSSPVLMPALLFAGRNAGGGNYDLLLPEGVSLAFADGTSGDTSTPQGGDLLSFLTALREVPWTEREARRVADGVPAVPADIGAGDLPQEGGDLARVAVSTSKGCYLGQEVIARWHATGQVRSGLFCVRLIDGAALVGAPDPFTLPAALTALPVRLYAGTKPVGELRSYAPQSGAGLALLRIHRLGDVRTLGLEAGGAAVFNVIEPMLS